jgi:GAF domain-containing protein
MSGVLLPFHRVVHDNQEDLFLNRIAQQAMSRTRATGSAIALSDGAAVTCWARAGLTSPQLGAKIDARSGLCARSMSTEKVLVCDDAETDSRADQEACCQLAIKSIATVPLHGNDRVIGVLAVFSRQPRAFNQAAIATLEQLLL